MVEANATAWYLASDAPIRTMTEGASTPDCNRACYAHSTPLPMIGAGVGEMFQRFSERYELVTQPGGSGKNSLLRPQIDLAVRERSLTFTIFPCLISA